MPNVIAIMPGIESINSMLAEVARANVGGDLSCYYSLGTLPPAESIARSLDAYFSAMKTSNSPPQTPQCWNIRTTELKDPKIQLIAATRRWFYELDFSPKVDAVTAERSINEFMKILQTMVGDSRVFEVYVDPPMWYDCDWQDFAFDGGDTRWFLHFGFSD